MKTPLALHGRPIESRPRIAAVMFNVANCRRVSTVARCSLIVRP